MRKTGRIIATLTAAVAMGTFGSGQAQAQDGPLLGLLSPLVCNAQNNVAGNNNQVNQTASCQQAATTPPPASGGVTGVETVRLPAETVPNFTQRKASCPAGKRVIGGGATATSSTFQASLGGSFPSSDNDGWIAYGWSPNSDDVSISVYAICATTS
ncbi:hypothetical protein ACGFT2_25250 [Streptomyces sp. NPDC048514]|uniref:hypothetical protein n=1 Tax=Streptomyces sp. NPDC048514 TaxID=3365564 RepID=UPI0037139CF3